MYDLIKTSVLLLLVYNTILITATLTNDTIDEQRMNKNPDNCNPLVIAHRGASGYVPEHTLASYSLAILMGADYIEPDLVMTKDGHIIARHDNELGLTTDVADHPEFADRHRNQSIDGNEVSGWFTEDFTLAEIKKLRAKERIPDIRPGNARLDGTFEVPTLYEIIHLVRSLEGNERRRIGIYPEIKHSSHFKLLGLSMEIPLVNILHNKGYYEAESPVYIQSFEVTNLKVLSNITKLRLIQLYEGDKSLQPYDQVLAGTSLTYGDMATADGLIEVASYAQAVGPDKSYIISQNETNRLGSTTTFVQDAHEAGLKVHPYTFRAENYFLPDEFKSKSASEAAIGDFDGELRAYIDAGIDGLFSDQPDRVVRLRGSCYNQNKEQS